jgi:hypothetical protein
MYVEWVVSRFIPEGVANITIVGYEELDGPAVSALWRAIAEVKQIFGHSLDRWPKMYHLELPRDSKGTLSP